jgi:hypothetical protein
LTPEEARQQRRHEVGQKLKRLLVVVGPLVGTFGGIIALSLLGTYVNRWSCGISCRSPRRCFGLS